MPKDSYGCCCWFCRNKFCALSKKTSSVHLTDSLGLFWKNRW